VYLAFLRTELYMPVKRKCKETLQQVRERLIVREQRLRTEQRVRELLEPEQLAVTEDDPVASDSEPAVTFTDKSKVAVSSQVILILIICSAWIAVLAYLFWFSRSHICCRI
jgi:hypothetical protein